MFFLILFYVSSGSDESLPRETFLSRLTEAGADDSLSTGVNDKEFSLRKNENMLSMVVSTIDDLWHEKDRLHSATLEAVPLDGTQ